MTAGNTLFRLARIINSPGFTPNANASHGRMVMAVEAVDAVKQRGTATINDIATELGIDQSGASRLMSQAISAGLVQRDRADSDGRARECGLTPAGYDLLHSARQWQENTFASLTDGWTETERQEFDASMQRIIEAANR